MTLLVLCKPVGAPEAPAVRQRATQKSTVVTMYRIKQSETDIDNVLNKAADAEDEGTTWPGMSYEQGVSAGIRWLIGDTKENPMENE